MAEIITVRPISDFAKRIFGSEDIQVEKLGNDMGPGSLHFISLRTVGDSGIPFHFAVVGNEVYTRDVEVIRG